MTSTVSTEAIVKQLKEATETIQPCPRVLTNCKSFGMHQAEEFSNIDFKRFIRDQIAGEMMRYMFYEGDVEKKSPHADIEIRKTTKDYYPEVQFKVSAIVVSPTQYEQDWKTFKDNFITGIAYTCQQIIEAEVENQVSGKINALKKIIMEK